MLVVFGRNRRAVSLAGLLLVLASAPAQPLLRPVAGVPIVSWVLTGLHPDAWLAYFAWSFTRDFRTWCDSAASTISVWRQSG